MEEMETVGK